MVDALLNEALRDGNVAANSISFKLLNSAWSFSEQVDTVLPLEALVEG